MANNHIVSIEKPAKLSIDTGRLKIAFGKAQEKHYFAPFDIAVLILAHPAILLSSAVSKELSNAGAVILHTGDNFMPVGITLPITTNQDGSKRPYQQAKYLNTNLTKPWWKQVVQSKIFGQASVIEKIDKENVGRLIALASKVLDGDKDNKEAQAAKFYWKIYFKELNSKIKERRKQGADDIVNASLNYSYAIIRSIVARSLAAAGLCLNFGIGHKRRDNPFNLVEDFIEPFRFIADKVIFNRLSTSGYKSLDSKLRKELLSDILANVIEINGSNYRLFQSIDFAVNSFCLSLEDTRHRLLLPNIQKVCGAKPIIQELFHIKYEI
jgi:CRISPR-associated protein Cas1